MAKNLGAIYTPEGYARILANWAIQHKTDLVLDMGVGPGVFVFHALDRLTELGATAEQACLQIYGTEIDKDVFDQFRFNTKSKGLDFSKILNADFFDTPFPKVDVLIGNPPYVRRRGLSEESITFTRRKTISNNPSLDEKKLSNLSDLYIYFLLYALPYIKDGGKLATIVADSWLNTNYGIILRRIH